MPKSCAQLMTRIDALRDQTESVRRKEIAGVGKCLRPGWLKAARASGKTLDEFSI